MRQLGPSWKHYTIEMWICSYLWIAVTLKSWLPVQSFPEVLDLNRHLFAGSVYLDVPSASLYSSPSSSLPIFSNLPLLCSCSQLGPAIPLRKTFSVQFIFPALHLYGLLIKPRLLSSLIWTSTVISQPLFLSPVLFPISICSPCATRMIKEVIQQPLADQLLSFQG